jgi:hypothetical protein
VNDTRGEYWVTFDVLESEAAQLEGATGGADDRVGGVVTQEPSDGTAMVVFQVVADDPDGAWRQAEVVYEELRGLAGLANAPSLGGTVTRLRDAPSTAPRTVPAPSEGPPRSPQSNLTRDCSRRQERCWTRAIASRAARHARRLA